MLESCVKNLRVLDEHFLPIVKTLACVVLTILVSFDIQLHRPRNRLPINNRHDQHILRLLTNMSLNETLLNPKILMNALKFHELAILAHSLKQRVISQVCDLDILRSLRIMSIEYQLEEWNTNALKVEIVTDGKAEVNDDVFD